ncbi:MAG: hypothetical protein LBE13_01215 [Bacteroidales bacterium]|nr:hypothetical protein [Bacteroidales bacterium]
MKKPIYYGGILSCLLVLLTSTFFTSVGCEEPKVLNTTTTQDTTIALAGTSWKLVGYVNIQESTMIEAEPKDCERCYTLVFDTDSTARGYSVINIIDLSLKPRLVMGTATMADDSMNGNITLYYEVMKTIQSYSIEYDTLKFYYNNNNNYLLFKSLDK